MLFPSTPSASQSSCLWNELLVVITAAARMVSLSPALAFDGPGFDSHIVPIQAVVL